MCVFATDEFHKYLSICKAAYLSLFLSLFTVSGVHSAMSGTHSAIHWQSECRENI